MKTSRILVFTILFVFMLCSASVFAQSNEASEPEQDIRISQLNFENIDPVKELESLKSKVQEDYKQGQIEKDELKIRLSKIDNKLKAVKEFNALSLDEKKDRLVKDFFRAVNKKVQEGKMDGNNAGKILSYFTDTVRQWDGKGFPTFYHREITIAKKGSNHHPDHHMHQKCLHHMHMALDKAVKAGVINESQKKEILKYLHESMKEMK